MRKLKLEMDALVVESFASDTRTDGEGTVRAHLSAYYEDCGPDDTGQASCTCEPTCNAQTCYACGTGGCTGVSCAATSCLAACGPTFSCPTSYAGDC